MKAVLLHTLAAVSWIFPLTGCSAVDVRPAGIAQDRRALCTDASVEEKVLRLDPERVTETDIRDVLSRCAAPRIIALNGSLPVRMMDSFSEFLIGMGYPEESIRDPRNGALSYSSYISSVRLAGTVAWYYENEGMMPILIGHSQGGMKVVEVLHELAGAFHGQIPVWNPLTGKGEARNTVRDPLTGAERPVIGLRVGYASSAAAGRLMRFILGQWRMLGRLRQVPDTVEEFSGFYIKYDPVGSDLLGFGGANTYYPLGTASVRTIRLPARHDHLTIPLTGHFARDIAARQWIQSYIPEEAGGPGDIAGEMNRRNIVFAGENWYYIKKYWCIELQRLMTAGKKEGQ